MHPRAAKALDLALLPLTFAWWTGAYGLGLGLPRGTPGVSPRPIPSRPFDGLAGAMAQGRPVVLAGVDRAWPALASWNPRSLAERLGSTPVDVVTLPEGTRNF